MLIFGRERCAREPWVCVYAGVCVCVCVSASRLCLVDGDIWRRQHALWETRLPMSALLQCVCMPECQVAF